MSIPRGFVCRTIQANIGYPQSTNSRANALVGLLNSVLGPTLRGFKLLAHPRKPNQVRSATFFLLFSTFRSLSSASAGQRVGTSKTERKYEGGEGISRTRCKLGQQQRQRKHHGKRERGEKNGRGSRRVRNQGTGRRRKTFAPLTTISCLLFLLFFLAAAGNKKETAAHAGLQTERACKKNKKINQE